MSAPLAHDDQMNDPGAYGEAFADVYDEWYQDVTDAQETARFVAERCPTGLVVEIGVGTGRLATPLLDRGLTVIGVDASVSMLSQCR
ncbi:MAG: class I SAM-dependent methyltransferase, partial [Actinomycetia bacterium]|nr:class I SAM-dependent methyltransferase [Actinomycetes bacterium]